MRYKSEWVNYFRSLWLVLSFFPRDNILNAFSVSHLVTTFTVHTIYVNVCMTAETYARRESNRARRETARKRAMRRKKISTRMESKIQ